MKCYIPLNGRMAMNDELEAMWKEASKAYFEVLFQNLARGIRKTTENFKHYSQPLC
jgi:hypothetical protein